MRLHKDRTHGEGDTDIAGRSKLKKLRSEPELGPSDFTEHGNIKARMLTSALRSRQQLHTASRNRPMLKSMGPPDAVDNSVRACFRFLIGAGLAATTHLLLPGDEHVGAVLDALKGKLKLSDVAAENIRSAMVERDVSGSFDLDKFNRVIEFLGDPVEAEE